MKKVLLYSLRLIFLVLSILFLLTCGAWIYFRYHKAEVLAYIKTESAKRLNGQIIIGDLNISPFHTFPEISADLQNISIRDSLWNQHHHDLLHADKAYASLNLFKLLTGHFMIDRIIIEKAVVYIFTDSSGYTNTSVFRKSEKHNNTATGNASYPSIEIRNSKLIVQKLDRNKLFSFDIKKLNCRINTTDDQPVLKLNVTIQALAHKLAFNLDNGSFIPEKKIEGKFKLQFNTASKVLQFEKILLQVDEQPFTMTGKFFLAEVPPPFTLSIQTENLPYKKAASFVSANIRRKLDLYDISGVISSFKATLDGTETEYRTPLIHLNIVVNDKTISTPTASFEHASFSGTFNNQIVKEKNRTDDNSMFRFNEFSGTWQGIKMYSDSIIVRDLIQPVVSCNVISDFKLAEINNITDDKTLLFNGGNAKMNLRYQGPFNDETGIARHIDGGLILDSASLTYLPRNFLLSDGKGRIRFSDQDMFIDELLASSGKTDLDMNGTVKNLFSLIDKNADKLLLDWSIKSASIDLNDFINFLKKPAGRVIKKKKKILFSESISKITGLIETGNVHLDLQAKKLVYKKFAAANLKAAIDLTDNLILLKSIVLDHAGGSLFISGSVANNPTSNPVKLTAQMNKVDVPRVLTAFNNFGQQAITDKNIKGLLTANIKLTGILTEKAAFIDDSTRGSIDFTLEKGELIQFEPVQKISQTIFKNRNFSDIQFADLKDRFDISGTAMTINRMEIHSTVMTMFVEGIYDMKKGADLSIQVPLSNLKDPKKDPILLNNGVNSNTGISALLHAKTGGDGKLKISWDPFKKASKKRQKKQKP